MLKSTAFSITTALLLLLLSAPAWVAADIYSWVDAKGVRHFSNTNTEGAGDQATSSPEFTLPQEEAQRSQQEAAETTARQGHVKADGPQPGDAAEQKRSAPVESGESKAQPEKSQAEARQAVQLKCKKARERLSALRFTSLHKYENPEVERYAVEWASRHLQNEQTDQKTNWRQARDEDVQKYKKFKYEQELRQAEQEVDEYCKK